MAKKGPVKKKTPVKKTISKPDASTKKINKSELIREYIAKHPKSGNKDIAEALAPQGINYGAVANVRQQLKTKSGAQPAGKRGRPAGSKSKASKTVKRAKPAASGALGSLEAAINFIQEAGGIDQAKAAIDTIEKIKASD